MQCYDTSGSLVRKTELFLNQNNLARICRTTPYSDVQDAVGGLRPNLTANSTLYCCHFYEAGVGYMFTECDNNVGIVVIPDLVGDARDQFYKNMTANATQPSSQQNASQSSNIVTSWNWTDFQIVVNDYCEGNTLSNSSSINNSSQTSPGLIEELDLPWQEWLNLSNENANPADWNLTEYKEWL